jgi:hypothetical protein
MITFTVLCIVLIALIIFGVFCLLAGGGAVVIVLGDLIVCALIILGLVKLFKRKK